MKKVIVLMLALVVVLTVLVSCGGDNGKTTTASQGTTAGQQVTTAGQQVTTAGQQVTTAAQQVTTAQGGELVVVDGLDERDPIEVDQFDGEVVELPAQPIVRE